MSESEQTGALADELDKLIERFRQEFQMSYASVVGVLQCKSVLLITEAKDRWDEGERA